MVENRHLPAVSVYLLNAALPKSGSLEILAQKRNDNQSAGEIEFAFHPPGTRLRVVAIVDSLAALLFVLMLDGYLINIDCWRREEIQRPCT
jgi:hypothetical protein